MFKAKVEVNPAIPNNYVTTATKLVILHEIVGSSNQSPQTLKRVQRVSPRAQIGLLLLLLLLHPHPQNEG